MIADPETIHAVGVNLFSWRRPATVMERLERRASRRSLAGFRGQIVAVNGLPEFRPAPAVVHNISTGGLAMLSDLRLEPADNVHLSFTFPGDELPTDVELSVIESRRLVTREYLTHCSFPALPPAVLRMVSDWTEARGPA